MVKKLLKLFNFLRRIAKKKEFRKEKVIKRKENKLYVEWKGCDN